MALNDVYRLTLVQSLHGQTVQNVTHWRFKTGTATAAGLRTTIADLIKDAIQAQQAGELVWEVARTRGLVPYSDTVETPFTAPVEGQLTLDSLPGMCAAVVSLRTGTAGKSHRGRFYLAGLEFVKEDNGKLLLAYQQAIQAVFDSLVAQFGLTGTNADYQWGVFSPKLGGTAAVGPPPKNTPYFTDPFNLAGFTAISQAIVRPQIGSFVTRKFGRGI